MEEYTRHPNTACIICKKAIYKRPGALKLNQGKAFCGQTCYGLSQRKEKPCIICDKPILASANKKTCSRSCANQHRAGIKYKLNRPNDKVKHYQGLKLILLKERGVTCQRCGFNKYEILQIHHKDGNHTNNKLENLELICPNCHAQEHYLEKSWLKKQSF